MCVCVCVCKNIGIHGNHCSKCIMHSEKVTDWTVALISVQTKDLQLLHIHQQSATKANAASIMNSKGDLYFMSKSVERKPTPSLQGA